MLPFFYGRINYGSTEVEKSFIIRRGEIKVCEQLEVFFTISYLILDVYNTHRSTYIHVFRYSKLYCNL